MKDLLENVLNVRLKFLCGEPIFILVLLSGVSLPPSLDPFKFIPDVLNGPTSSSNFRAVMSLVFSMTATF